MFKIKNSKMNSHFHKIQGGCSLKFLIWVFNGAPNIFGGIMELMFKSDVSSWVWQNYYPWPCYCLSKMTKKDKRKKKKSTIWRDRIYHQIWHRHYLIWPYHNLKWKNKTKNTRKMWSYFSIWCNQNMWQSYYICSLVIS